MNILDRLPIDKSHHAIGGAIIALATAILASLFGYASYANYAGCAAGVLAGIAKEADDWWINRPYRKRGLLPPHEVSFYDFLATACGAVVPLLGWLIASMPGVIHG